MPAVQESVGEILSRELDYRGWSQADFAAVLDRPTQFVNEILKGKKELTRESASQVGAALGTSAEFWLRLQDQYLLAKQGLDANTNARLDEVRVRARLNELAPLELLKKRGFLRGSSTRELEAGLLELFELRSLGDEPGFSAAARRANRLEDLTVLQRAWFACVRKQARRQPPSSKFSSRGLRKLARSLSTMLLAPEDFESLPGLFEKVGVRLVFVDAFPSAKIDGCAMYVDGYPVIGLSGRGKRLDKILFTLLHEVAHVLLGHVDTHTYIVEEIDSPDVAATKHEQAADEEAEVLLFPEGFPRIPSRVSGPWVEQTAADLGIAPIVITGYLQHLKRLDWRTTLAKNAPSVGDALEAWR